MTDTDLDIVGMRVKVTLVAPSGGENNPGANVVPSQIEGTVYSVNPNSGFLVLMTQAGSERSSFKMLKLGYVENIELVASADGKKAGTPAADQALPSGVASYTTLPALQTDAGENLEKKISQKKRQGEENRKYTGVEDDLCIRALEVLDQLSRVYPDARWDEDRNCIAVGKDIFVTGTPSWMKPKVKAADPNDAARITRTLEKK